MKCLIVSVYSSIFRYNHDTIPFLTSSNFLPFLLIIASPAYPPAISSDYYWSYTTFQVTQTHHLNWSVFPLLQRVRIPNFLIEFSVLIYCSLSGWGSTYVHIYRMYRGLRPDPLRICRRTLCKTNSRTMQCIQSTIFARNISPCCSLLSPHLWDALLLSPLFSQGCSHSTLCFFHPCRLNMISGLIPLAFGAHGSSPSHISLCCRLVIKGIFVLSPFYLTIYHLPNLLCLVRDRTILMELIWQDPPSGHYLSSFCQICGWKFRVFGIEWVDSKGCTRNLPDLLRLYFFKNLTTVSTNQL